MGKLNRCGDKNKVCYPTQGAAIKRALISSSRRGVALRMYRCPDCKNYHLTKRPRWESA